MATFSVVGFGLSENDVICRTNWLGMFKGVWKILVVFLHLTEVGVSKGGNS